MEDLSAQQIESVMSRCAKEQGVKAGLDSLKDKLADLTARFNDITTKYKALRQNITHRLESFRQTQQQRILLEEQERQKTDERLLKAYNEARTEIEQSFAEKIAEASNVIDSVKSEQNDCEKELLKLKYLVPFKEEKESLNQQLNELQLKEKELTGKISSLASDINRVQAEYDKKETETTADYQRQSEEKQAEIEKYSEQIASIARLLERTKGSLYEWLEENKADWEQNIGKVINEEKVLYQTGLHPQNTEGASLYGVKLDLTDLPLYIRKPKELEKEKDKLEKVQKQAKDEWQLIQQQQEKAIEELKRQFASQIKEFRQQKSLAETELRMIPQQRKAIAVRIEDYEAKAKQIIEQQQQ